MMEFLLIGLALIFSAEAQTPSAPFTSSWNVTNLPLNIKFPLVVNLYNLTVDWGDNITSNHTVIPVSHNYSSPGIYTIKVYGNLPGWSCGMNDVNCAMMTSISSWGGFTIDSNSSGCLQYTTNLLVINATDQPIMRPGATLQSMFSSSVMNSPLSWNLANVSRMDNMFSDNLMFNSSLNFIFTGNVISTRNMFSGASSFNQPLNFDTSSVTDMFGMFFHAGNFNQPLNFTSTRNVVSMRQMFSGATNFNQPLSLDTRNVTDMREMFYEAKNFNQPLNFTSTRNVIDMATMFGSTYVSKFNQPLNFDTSSVTDMNNMFSSAKSFNQPLNFDTRSVIDMQSMFIYAESFNQPLNFTNTRNVTNMQSMFRYALNFNQPLNFDTSSVIDMDFMFDTCPMNQSSTQSWNTSQVGSCSSFCAFCALPAFLNCTPCIYGRSNILCFATSQSPTSQSPTSQSPTRQPTPPTSQPTSAPSPHSTFAPSPANNSTSAPSPLGNSSCPQAAIQDVFTNCKTSDFSGIASCSSQCATHLAALVTAFKARNASVTSANQCLDIVNSTQPWVNGALTLLKQRMNFNGAPLCNTTNTAVVSGAVTISIFVAVITPFFLLWF